MRGIFDESTTEKPNDYCRWCGNLRDWCESHIENTHGACCKKCTHLGDPVAEQDNYPEVGDVLTLTLTGPARSVTSQGTTWTKVGELSWEGVVTISGYQVITVIEDRSAVAEVLAKIETALEAKKSECHEKIHNGLTPFLRQSAAIQEHAIDWFVELVRSFRAPQSEGGESDSCI